MLEQLGQRPGDDHRIGRSRRDLPDGTKKAVNVLEDAGLVRTTVKSGRARICALGPRRLDEVEVFVAAYRRMLDEQLDRLGELLERTKGEQ